MVRAAAVVGIIAFVVLLAAAVVAGILVMRQNRPLHNPSNSIGSRDSPSTVQWPTVKKWLRPGAECPTMRSLGIDVGRKAWVAKHWDRLWRALDSGYMPPTGRWSQKKLDQLRAWHDAGMP